MKKPKSTLSAIKKLDKSGMLNLLLGFPQQCEAAVKIAGSLRISAERDFKKIIFLGLGGSAIGADLVKAYLYFESRLPVLVLREYVLPAYVDDSCLVFAVSYSGNTEETLSAYKEAGERGSKIIAISCGGRLKEYAQKDNVSFIEIPPNIPPRCALGYLSIIPLCILAQLRLIKDVGPSINAMVSVLEGLKKNSLSPYIQKKENIAKFIAEKIKNKFPIIYSASIHFDVCALRLRGQLAENSKALSSSHLFPEMNHNEIVGWQNPKKLFKGLAVIMLRDKDMHPRTAKRMDITAKILKEEGIQPIEIRSAGEGILSRIFSIIYIGDFISYYLAILYGIDPTPVDKVTYLKNELVKA